jgi:hypothetical protein
LNNIVALGYASGWCGSVLEILYLIDQSIVSSLFGIQGQADTMALSQTRERFVSIYYGGSGHRRRGLLCISLVTSL